ncbi:L-serine ammonia-lyase, iron-sulfur-dependent, subunit alpha [Yersinia ruckeri]|uniref:L-cysteine desulfidase family protein n=1 Tax=Yersinia ruckeri TaxID=29486 RepID=UPI00119E7179|nr:L-serine ammonia-lyase, iron-sulfur-dependent, subunit alpha [Yersinia ruckeri]EKN3347172.1 serine dehydratase subunit alpha family protein [Yersinia ruckeri]EKN3362695.1 serine dehydratase subunit alpha family protein [Yersinia ruckeri]EKN4202221.1 serine dehydratase subunit alpha family protein [Yersinia ruckeri]EKN4208431.1 serine dehydratase subunit alpha family protein [Yersinia ruckeri]EKN4699215.1 serine dehydratase subunit alpha family protein [Yersinia ruckeri]
MSHSSHSELWNEFIRAVRQEVQPAVGCTEPISLALAAAIAASHLSGPAERIEARVSPNLMKNGMGVTVPGTGMVGLPIAAAVGALAGDAQAGLEVLQLILPEKLAAAKAMLAAGVVQVAIQESDNILFSEAKLYRGKEWVTATIAGGHTRLVKIEKNGEVLFDISCDAQCSENHDEPASAQGYCLKQANAYRVYQFATEVPFERIAFILQAAKLNGALSHEGLKGQYGLHIGATLERQRLRGLLARDLLSDIMIRTASASDARMGGATLPAMSNSGSGNQGIAATMPVVVVAEYLGSSEEQLARALMLSHLMAIYIHSQLPALSALCAATTASMGAAAGMAWLIEPGYDTVAMAISSMIGDISGIICDGAANSCAMKVSTSATAAYKAVLMALDHSGVTGNEGIVAGDVDQSIANLCALACGAMRQTDSQIIEIMAHKACI